MIPVLAWLVGCGFWPSATLEGDTGDVEQGIDYSASNVAACEGWVRMATCGDFDFGSVVDCEDYAVADCDFAPYFGCLAEQTSCDEEVGVPTVDPEGVCYDEAAPCLGSTYDTAYGTYTD